MDASQAIKFLRSLPDEAIAVLYLSFDDAEYNLREFNIMSDSYTQTFKLLKVYIDTEWLRRGLLIHDFTHPSLETENL